MRQLLFCQILNLRVHGGGDSRESKKGLPTDGRGGVRGGVKHLGENNITAVPGVTAKFYV